MTSNIPNQPESEAESESAQRDLRSELQTDLVTQFEAKLNTNGTLPTVVSKALVALLSAQAPTSSDVIAALALEDPIEPEALNE
jgi:hypothetical protein